MREATWVMPFFGGDKPVFIKVGAHVYSQPGHVLTHWVHEGFWYEYPDGKDAVFYEEDGKLFGYPPFGTPRYRLEPEPE